jgi:heme/copper-type cytochrome/quinol oxidase subunit 4
MVRPHPQFACFVSQTSPPSSQIRNKASFHQLHATNFPFTTSSLLTSEAVQTASQTFEPQVNTPALSAFLIIAVVFSLLQFRINKERDASERRTEALNTLRQVKSSELDAENRRPSEEEVAAAVASYKYALEEELSLRTIIPGIRIVAPNDPKRTEKDIAAAKQFLDMDLEADELVPAELGEVSAEPIDEEKRKNELLLQSRRRFDGTSGEKKDEENEGELSNGAKATLLAIALTQIALLVVLSFDPMTADNVFTAIGGNPPDDLLSR